MNLLRRLFSARRERLAECERRYWSVRKFYEENPEALNPMFMSCCADSNDLLSQMGYREKENAK